MYVLKSLSIHLLSHLHYYNQVISWDGYTGMPHTAINCQEAFSLETVKRH